jgi:hypothetical protein
MTLQPGAVQGIARVRHHPPCGRAGRAAGLWAGPSVLHTSRIILLCLAPRPSMSAHIAPVHSRRVLLLTIHGVSVHGGPQGLSLSLTVCSYCTCVHSPHLTPSSTTWASRGSSGMYPLPRSWVELGSWVELFGTDPASSIPPKVESGITGTSARPWRAAEPSRPTYRCRRRRRLVDSRA